MAPEPAVRGKGGEIVLVRHSSGSLRDQDAGHGIRSKRLLGGPLSVLSRTDWGHFLCWPGRPQLLDLGRISDNPQDFGALPG